jgi:CubicO group peptidase (beta-lactamase class C family)
MTTDTIFWIASCTKLITAVAAMQLVEQHKVDLDNGQQTEDILHELKSIKVIEEMADGKLRLVDKKRQITLRMLLSHTGMSHISPDRRMPSSRMI